jgi:hypothetical protein
LEGGTDRFNVTPVALRYTRGALWYGAGVLLTKGTTTATTPPPALLER